jgi:type II secretory ATPase GspE/PulE/Tfp pilus assembly ATPase PilB-like protein
LANLNISEVRLPQDGSVARIIGDEEIEFRISCLPTQFGESIVLRVLNNGVDRFSLDALMEGENELKVFLRSVADRSGLTLFVGPTGCGKSTTLYSVLREINCDDIKILTCEDPVEQKIYGLSQSNINSDVGFTFAGALRAFLRHDPDVVFVGEIRDCETAELAVRAAITGHCVLSTLHANNAIGAVPRLIDLGVDKTLIADALLCVVYQQLEKIAENERKKHSASERRAVFDAIFIDDDMKQMIKSGSYV